MTSTTSNHAQSVASARARLADFSLPDLVAIDPFYVITNGQVTLRKRKVKVGVPAFVPPANAIAAAERVQTALKAKPGSTFGTSHLFHAYGLEAVVGTPGWYSGKSAFGLLSIAKAKELFAPLLSAFAADSSTLARYIDPFNVNELSKNPANKLEEVEELIWAVASVYGNLVGLKPSVGEKFLNASGGTVIENGQRRGQGITWDGFWPRVSSLIPSLNSWRKQHNAANRSRIGSRSFLKMTELTYKESYKPLVNVQQLIHVTMNGAQKEITFHVPSKPVAPNDALPGSAAAAVKKAKEYPDVPVIANVVAHDAADVAKDNFAKVKDATRGFGGLLVCMSKNVMPDPTAYLFLNVTSQNFKWVNQRKFTAGNNLVHVMTIKGEFTSEQLEMFDNLA